MNLLRGAALLAAAFAVAAPAHAELYYLIVGGLGGQAEYQERFDKQVNALIDVARRTTGESRVIALTGESATREALTSSIESLRTRAKPADTLAVILIGHGSFDGETYKFNLPGPDIDGEEFGKLLSSVPARSQLVVNATSASGAVLETWAAEGRTVITATRSGFERNATRFAEHFAAALAEGAADINKNGTISAQEAFDYAARAVADSFEREGKLATEHPQIAGGAPTRFALARLGSAAPAAASAARDPAVAALEAERDRLDGEIEDLRARRAELEPDAYLNQLQQLLVRLADVQAQIDAAAGRGQ